MRSRRPRSMRRAHSVGAVLTGLLLSLAALGVRDARAEEPAAAFGFENVEQIAKDAASKPFQEPKKDLPNSLKKLGYDDYRKIRFRPEMALWRNERLFEVQFFHVGFLYQQPVTVHVVQGGQVVQAPFRAAMFDYGGVSIPEILPADLGFAGFRVHYPLQTSDYKDEITVFLGASYFRLLGRDQRFGASARGLAIDTALPKGEEFPFFRQFWLVAPESHDTQLTVYALLDSPKVAGAYQFRIEPGTDTRVEVKAKLFVRQDIEKIGIAPLTSMFFFGENKTRGFDDFRPEAHDSDGLMSLTGMGEWIWRPLVNPKNLRVSAFVDENPRGFGLMQRDREFQSYLDLEAEYHKRPSLWVEPLGNWGPGVVELVEIPTEQEIHDNIVAYWVPKRETKGGDVLELSYRLFAYLTGPYRVPRGQVARTRIGSASVPGSPNPLPKETRLFVVDFDGGDLPYLSPQLPVEAEIANSGGRVFDKVVVRNTESGGWRVAFRFDPEGQEAVDLKLFLSLRDKRLSETWTYLWTRDLYER